MYGHCYTPSGQIWVIDIQLIKKQLVCYSKIIKTLNFDQVATTSLSWTWLTVRWPPVLRETFMLTPFFFLHILWCYPVFLVLSPGPLGLRKRDEKKERKKVGNVLLELRREDSGSLWGWCVEIASLSGNSCEFLGLATSSPWLSHPSSPFPPCASMHLHFSESCRASLLIWSHLCYASGFFQVHSSLSSKI